MFKKELYRYNSNYQNCKYYSYRLIPLPFEQRFTSISARPLFKAVPSRISRWRPCFHYTAQCPVLDHAGFHFSLSPSHPFRRFFSRPGGCSTFCKSSDISTGVCSTFNLAPVNERTLISLSRVSRVRDSGVAFVGEFVARVTQQTFPLSAIGRHHDSSDYSIPSRCLKRIRRKFDLN